MNITKMKLTIVGICGLMLTPLTSNASGATLLNDTTALFTIDFSFTDKLFEVQVPIAAEYGIEHNDRVDTVGYTIETEEFEKLKLSKVNALVLSTANIEGNRYSLEKNETGTFTLVILATFEENLTKEQTAHITKLPYRLDERRTSLHQNKLDRFDKPTLE